MEKIIEGQDMKVLADGRTVVRFSDGAEGLVRWMRAGGDKYLIGRRAEVGYMHRTHCVEGQRDRGQECACRPKALLFID